MKRWGNNHAVPSKFNLDFVFDMDDEAYKGLVEIFDKLAAYESTGFSPADIEMIKYPAEAALKFACELQSYKDAEKEGLLIRLPCKVGDTVYFWWREIHLEDVEIKEIMLDGNEIIFDAFSVYNHLAFRKSDIGKTVFLTREEAEAALKGVRG